MALELKPAFEIIGPGGVNLHIGIREVKGEQIFGFKSSNRLAGNLLLHGLRSKARDRPSSWTTLVNDVRKPKGDACHSECKVRNKHWTREALARLLVTEDTLKEVTLFAIGDEPSATSRVVDDGAEASKNLRLDKRGNSVESAAVKTQSWQVGGCEVE
ncbi:unnamed protein product, partial [Prorocentrum cordatum]